MVMEEQANKLQTVAKKKLYLVTTNYPNKGGDSVFVLPELRELVKRFHVTVICTSGKKNSEFFLPNVEYRYYEQKLTKIKKIFYILKYPLCKACRRELRSIWKRHRREKMDNFWGRVRKSIEFYACAEEFYVYFRTEICRDRNEEAMLCTFWCNEFSLPLVIHHEEYPKMHLVTRLHGYDLYEERYLYGRQPFKEIINERMEKLFFVADRSRQYYLEKYPQLDKQKTEVSRLGVKCIDISKQKKGETGNLLVSCSNVIPLKRLEIIIHALSLLEHDIKWIHFGTGECMEEIQKLARLELGNKKNISYEFRGRVSNAEIYTFYEQNIIDCFITTSATEGCPVSVMEALAAGIPVIGTAVGEIPFMIDRNGVLLNENPSADEVSRAINQIIESTDKQKIRMRERSVQIWKEYFDVESNAPVYAQKVLGLMN